MKKVGDLFTELGFRPDASDSVKRAFVENLVRAADRSAPRPNSNAAAAVAAGSASARETAASVVPTPTKRADEPQQLAFNFGDEPGTPFPLTKKRSAG